MDSDFTKLNAQQASEFLDCSYGWLMKYVRENKIPHFRLGKKVYFVKESLILWILEKQRNSVSQ